MIFAEYNRIIINEEEKKYLEMTKVPTDFHINIQDLKVLGKREVIGIIKFRTRVNTAMKKKEND